MAPADALVSRDRDNKTYTKPHHRRRDSFHAGLRTQRLFKTGGRLIQHARYFIAQLAENHLTGHLFRQILGRIERLEWHPTDRADSVGDGDKRATRDGVIGRVSGGWQPRERRDDGAISGIPDKRAQRLDAHAFNVAERVAADRLTREPAW
jgi:hypothetical protein